MDTPVNMNRTEHSSLSLAKPTLHFPNCYGDGIPLIKDRIIMPVSKCNKLVWRQYLLIGEINVFVEVHNSRF